MSSRTTITSANLGFPRIGAFRELKKAVESYWKGESTEDQLQATAKEIRATNWKKQADAGINFIPSNDFSFYDQILDLTATVGAVPARYNFAGGNVDLTTYFAMARGQQANGKDVVAMEMTKWFDTNYHYLVPEFSKSTAFKLSSTKIVDQYNEAKALGIETRPVITGPVTYLTIGKAREEGFNKLSLLNGLTAVYAEIFAKLEAAGATHIQIDEPILATDLDAETKAAFETVYAGFAKATKLNITLTTYFDGLRDNTKLAANLPTWGLHIDLVRAPQQLDEVLAALPAEKTLSVGVIDGRNIWKNNYEVSLKLINQAVAKLGKGRVIVAPSCSLLHTPVDLTNEKKFDAEFKSWLAYATQKLTEIATLTKAANDGEASVAAELEENKKAIENRKTSPRTNNKAVQARVAALSEKDITRVSPFAKRIEIQHAALGLPLLPTTTIGSFPQTAEVRAARAKFKKGELTEAQYNEFLEKETIACIKYQDSIGIDVPVHGEFERNDMVEYFGEQLEGYAFSENGWVQSYGSRCVKPPVIFGDVSRPKAMTVRWAEFAQAQTKNHMKGMLTGPVTMLQWAFVRDDQPREITCKQIAFAIRDEVVDLEKAGIKIIQIDEAAIREGLPLRRADWAAYLRWAVDSFRITASGVKDETQIHTHMCYSEFNDIIGNVAEMDADVISIETSRSAMELLDAFVKFKYPNEIGPGVYDIHSPRVPKQEEMTKLLEKALEVLKPEQIWVNPDCGLKTRGWAETKPALEGMVKSAIELRTKLAGAKKAANG